MRVAVIAGTYRPKACGVADYTARLCAALAPLGVETVVLTDREAACDAPHEADLPSAARTAPAVRAAGAGWRARDLPHVAAAVRRVRPDLVHVQHAAGTYGFRRAIFALPPVLRAAGWRGPLVTTAHEYGWWEWRWPGPLDRVAEWGKRWGQARGWWDREDGWLLTMSDAVVTTNADAERAIRERLPHLADRVHRVPIGANVCADAGVAAPADARETRVELRARYGWAADAHVVAFFGFLHPVKGLETLLEAFARLARRRPEARLLLVGGVESLALRGDDAARYGAALDGRTAALGLAGLVRRTGYLPAAEASRHLAGADVGVLPFTAGVTLKSGSLLALLAHGLPVVVAARASGAGGGADPLAGAPVVRVAARAADALADALAALLGAEDAHRARVGAEGRAFAARFGWGEIARRHDDLYRALLDARRGG